MTFLNTHAPSGHARCRNLRCKEMYYHVQLGPQDKSPLVTDAREDGHVYWCVKTTKEFGPDRQQVSLEACSPDRECYRA
jgi:hypothetical protein